MRPAGDRAPEPGPSGTVLPSASLASCAAASTAPVDPLPVLAGLARRASRLQRILATALAFAVFGLGAALLALGVFPLCRATAPSRTAADDRVQAVIHRAFRGYLRMAERLGLIRTRWVGREALRTPGAKLVVANHPTLIDFVQLAAELPQADCIVSDARTRSPFLGLAAQAAGYLSNARGAALIDACAERLRAGRTVVLFPEGTRSPAEGMHPFHRGAAHVALSSGVPLLPVFITCEPRMLMKGSRFWDVPERSADFTLRVLAPLDPRALAQPNVSRGVAARRLTTQLRRRLGERAL